jgi:hypothetical protein
MDAEDALSIGARARKVRTRRGLSLDVAAGLAGISARWRSQSGCWRTARRHPQAVAVRASAPARPGFQDLAFGQFLPRRLRAAATRHTAPARYQRAGAVTPRRLSAM